MSTSRTTMALDKDGTLVGSSMPLVCSSPGKPHGISRRYNSHCRQVVFGYEWRLIMIRREKDEETLGQRPQGLYPWIWRLISTVSTVAWMGVIFYLSSLPPFDLPRQVEAVEWLGRLRDIVGHLVLYGVLGSLLLVSLWNWVAGSIFQLRWALVGLGLGVLCRVTDEYHQSYVTGRSASSFDVFIDSVGVASVWLAVGAARRWRGHGSGKDRA